MRSSRFAGNFRITVGGMLAGSLLAFSIRSVVVAASAPLGVGLTTLMNWIIRRSRLDLYPISVDVAPWEMLVAQVVSAVLLLIVAVRVAYWLHPAGTATKPLREKR